MDTRSGKTSSRNCLGCRYYMGDRKCKILPWESPIFVPDEEGVCLNFCYREVYCSVCGKPINPLKLLMAHETVSSLAELKRLDFEGVETKLSNEKYVVHCIKCISKEYSWSDE